jgi:Gram-negative bacterial TonB protein C-terminal
VSITAAPSPTGAHPTRRAPRFPAAIPVDITVLRSGIPYTIPGRSTNFGEFGMGAMLAGELTAGDLIGVAFRVPEVDTPIRTRALVRHQAKLQCGLSFVGLLPEQQMIIERWSRRMAGTKPASRFQEIAATKPEIAPPLKAPDKRRQGYRIVLLILAIVLVTGSLGWWHWYQAWQDLESRLQGKTSITLEQRTVVPAGVMEQLLIHKVDPVLSETDHPVAGQDVVVLNAIIGKDGAVMTVSPLSGPESLAAAATDAVKWWKYQPYLINGQPVEVETTVTVNFQGN